jgi:hypothetical protein
MRATILFTRIGKAAPIPSRTQEGKNKTNDRLLGVAVHSYDHEDLESIEEHERVQQVIRDWFRVVAP